MWSEKCKINKYIESGLYRQPNKNFQGPKSKGISRGMYVKILFVVYNDVKIQLQLQLLQTCHPFFRSTLFSFNLATFFCPRTAFNCFNFQRIVNNNNNLSFLFRPLVSSVKNKNFQCISVFYQIVLEKVIRVLQFTYELVPFYENPSWRELYSNFINSA